MGTNYYGHLPDGATVHFGKRSAGWTFLFHVEPNKFSTFDELIGWLENTPCEIVTEYGARVDPVEFMHMAANWDRDGHRQRSCPCGDDPAIHGPAWRYSGWTNEFQHRDDKDHDWFQGEFV